MLSEFFAFVGRVLRGVVAMVLWLFAAAVGLGFLLLALAVFAVAVLWSLLRGRRPQRPVFVSRMQRFTRDRVWPGSTSDRASEVVDVESREVPEQQERR